MYSGVHTFFLYVVMYLNVWCVAHRMCWPSCDAVRCDAVRCGGSVYALLSWQFNWIFPPYDNVVELAIQAPLAVTDAGGIEEK